MTDEGVTISLSPDEALVLFEWLSRAADTTRNYETLVTDDAERIVLWNMHSALESKLVAPLSPAYAELLTMARVRVRGDAP